MKANDVTTPTKTPPPERIELPGGYTLTARLNAVGGAYDVALEAYGLPFMQGEMHDPQAFAAAMNCPTDGLREALEESRRTLEYIAVFGGGMLNQPVAANGPNEAWLEKRIQHYERECFQALELVKAALAATPQTPADQFVDKHEMVSEPSVLPSDERSVIKWARAYWPSSDAEANVYPWDEVLRALEEYAAHRTAHQYAADNGWRDIESAPKDGTEILLRYVSGAIYHALWLQDENNPIGWHTIGTLGQCIPLGPVGLVSYWRPLPTPPQGHGRVG